MTVENEEEANVVCANCGWRGSGARMQCPECEEDELVPLPSKLADKVDHRVRGSSNRERVVYWWTAEELKRDGWTFCIGYWMKQDRRAFAWEEDIREGGYTTEPPPGHALSSG